MSAARHAASRKGKVLSVAGGGETVSALHQAGGADGFSFISTAGGAFLEWLEARRCRASRCCGCDSVTGRTDMLLLGAAP